MVSIEKTQNGYIVRRASDVTVYRDDELDKAFNHILLLLTGKSPSFLGDSFGEIRVNFDYKLRLSLVEESK